MAYRATSVVSKVTIGGGQIDQRYCGVVVDENGKVIVATQQSFQSREIAEMAAAGLLAALPQ